MGHPLQPENLSDDVERHAALLFDKQQRHSIQGVDRLFIGLMLGQWAFGILVALLVSPYTWRGQLQGVHPHVFAAVVLGGLLSSLPIAMALWRPAEPVTRHTIAVAQALWSALLIHLTGGRIESHFHVFGSLAVLSFYRDWRVIGTATAVVIADHFARGLLWPESVYGMARPEWWRFLEHAFWVAFEDVFLVIACVRGVREMREMAERRAHSEVLSWSLESQVEARTAELAQAQSIAHIGSWRWDLRRQEVSWSEELYRLLDKGPESAPASLAAFMEAVHPDDRAPLQAALEAAAREGRPFSVEHRITGPGGGTRTLISSARIQRHDGDGPAVLIGTAQDITEQREVQTRLMFAERMTSVGTLAAGVAHEINNPLAYVISNLEFVEPALGKLALEIEWTNVGHANVRAELDELVLALREAQEGAGRVRDIVRDLRVFARADEDRRGPIDLARVVETSVNMAWNEIRHRARLEKDFGETPVVHGNDARLGQVVLNLLINAAHAIPVGHADQHRIGIRTRTDAAGRAVIEVSDTGSGIAPEIRSRIFDPFFTTKPVGVGTGLGLSICHGIVSGMGGEIEIESELGVGTTFRVSLPVNAAEDTTSTPAALPAASGTRARVLIIDDEPKILTSLRRVLVSTCQVVTAERGEDALAMLSAGECFDVILCDVMMPDMSGLEVHAKIASLSPEAARSLVFVSGGVFAQEARQSLDGLENEILEKPVDTTKLLELIAQRVRARAAALPPTPARPMLRVVGNDG